MKRLRRGKGARDLAPADKQLLSSGVALRGTSPFTGDVTGPELQLTLDACTKPEPDLAVFAARGAGYRCF